MKGYLTIIQRRTKSRAFIYGTTNISRGHLAFSVYQAHTFVHAYIHTYVYSKIHILSSSRYYISTYHYPHSKYACMYVCDCVYDICLRPSSSFAFIRFHSKKNEKKNKIRTFVFRFHLSAPAASSTAVPYTQ